MALPVFRRAEDRPVLFVFCRALPEGWGLVSLSVFRLAVPEDLGLMSMSASCVVRCFLIDWCFTFDSTDYV